MKKLFTIFLMMFAIFAMSFSMTSCTSINLNDIKKTVATKVSDGVATSLECSRPDLIQEDLYTLLKVQKIEVAEKDEKTILSAVCKVAAGQVLPLLVKAGIPKKWECKATMAEDAIKQLAEKACSLI